jgi:uncharacterized protein (DUF736 family)
MKTIGYFRRDGEDFIGRIATLQLDVTVRLKPVEKISAKAPTFRAYAGDHECGAAWPPHDPASGTLLNVRLDDPTWAEPIDARLVAGEEDLPMVWSRKVEDKDHEPRQRPAQD